ncbi:sugar phosphate isomerase/epimerase family protein [Paenibacillus thalictri]|uniref:Sugar phosphate isomerase/epimerase n=1 Tax=Paenibacillus thalictri TaxID=2527873 RepID=A0A4Q9DMN9_9BACL|nr:TIM barrel protein [Paenibacillus thalictri]TBL76044.1 sugar phosphate isomerase/epimerase [Paenibacillus thalictri]
MFTDKGEYSFSTCWNIKRHDTGRGMIEEIKELGFRRVELNYNVTRELLSTIEPMIEQGEIAVSSVHNTFPHVADPDYGTDSVLLGFDDETKRQRAIELLCGSIDYAHRYGAEAVVVHPGEVPFEDNIDARLKKLYHEFGKNSPEYRRLWGEMLSRREALSLVYTRKIGESLERVSDYIARKGYDVIVGIETRSRCYQMPTPQEAKTIIDGLKGAPVHLWYDFGHAMMMDRMGLYDSVKDAHALKSYIYGLHIHETLELSDHYCPYVHSGTDVFDDFLDIVRDAPLKVYELKAICKPEEIEESHNRIIRKMEALAQ